MRAAVVDHRLEAIAGVPEAHTVGTRRQNVSLGPDDPYTFYVGYTADGTQSSHYQNICALGAFGFGAVCSSGGSKTDIDGLYVRLDGPNGDSNNTNLAFYSKGARAAGAHAMMAHVDPVAGTAEAYLDSGEHRTTTYDRGDGAAIDYVSSSTSDEFAHAETLLFKGAHTPYQRTMIMEALMRHATLSLSP